MKKIITTIAVLGTLIPALTFAKTDVSVVASTKTVKVGDVITVTIALNPAGESAYTSKVAVSFPVDMLQATGFTFAPSWLSLSQPGYDLMDNTTGSLIKTAGYPNGLATSATFGTATFKAVKAGTATIAVNSGTMIYDQNNQNVFSGLQNSAQITINAVVITPVTTPAVTPKTTVTNQAPAVTNPVPTVETPVTTNTDQTAAVVQSGSSNVTLYGVIALVMVLGLAATLFAFRKKIFVNQPFPVRK
ncbi:MAG: cohesin domain-containing protein [Minisyncoccia bacterium]